jgi:RNA methyltransferase, TrmH family
MAMAVGAESQIRQITSATNSLVKVFRRALADGRTRDGWVAIEGPRFVEEALDAKDCAVHSVLITGGAAAQFSEFVTRLPQDAEIAQVPDAIFEALSGTKTPQGIAALVELPRWRLDEVLARAESPIVVACGLQDPGNLGTLVRSAQALGAAALVTLPATVSPFNPKALRSSAGAIFRLPVFAGIDSGDLLARLRRAGTRVIATDAKSGQDATEAALRGRVAILIGQEATGLNDVLRREADLQVKIPIRADADSLNAATAASILLYEAARQRGFVYEQRVVKA